MHISKLHGWWARAAAFVRAVGTLRYVAKVDDDAYLHLPNLHHDLRRLDCVEHWVYGTIGWIGIRPYPLSKCGYSWPQDAGVFLKRGCHTRGHRPPHPFPVGILQVLSRGVVQYVGESNEVSAFAARAASLREPSRGEDQVLGFWASRARLDGGLDVAYVKAGPQMGDLRCGDTSSTCQRTGASRHAGGGATSKSRAACGISAGCCASTFGTRAELRVSAGRARFASAGVVT